MEVYCYMSIIASVYLKDAIIMSADSRITGEYRQKTDTFERVDRYTISDNGQKIFAIKNNTIGISSCGTQKVDDKPIAEIIRLFEKEIVDDNDTVCEIPHKLIEFVKGKYKDNLIFHVGGYKDGIKFFYRIENDEIINSIQGDSCGAMWNGEPQVLANLLGGEKGIPIEWEYMQLKDGVDFAEFLIDVTCKIHRFQKGLGTCGGPIDILLLAKNYSKWVKHKVF